ncbi:LysR family transcriptional regulator [Vibrio mediterranei]|uniref:Transcriptional regulator n=1 Tax=Vibrio mediterranei TaxID=689 RepID=A0AAN1FK08_9VIBR|nr:LysR family transcriptional regulator [Vibrio mediterranei]ASI91687.1 transcriptional regulator [Vibrio mediterranei]
MDSIFGYIDDVYLFCKVVEHGSVLKTANLLGVPQSTVSRRISSLEERLGLRLLEKKGRELAATEIGKLVFDQLSSGIEQLEIGLGNVTEQTEQVAGTVRLSAPHSFYHSFVAPVVEGYLKQYPKVHIDLALNHDQLKPQTNRELLITFDISEMDDLIARPLFTARHGFFASAEYLANRSQITHIEQLQDLDWLAIDNSQKLAIYRDDALEQSMTIKPRLVVNDIQALLDAVERGLGVASLPLRHVRGNSNLVHLLPEHYRSDRQAFLVYKDRKYQPKAVKSLIDAILSSADTMDAAVNPTSN